MDNATAQTGITIWDALLIASIPGIIMAIISALFNRWNSIKLLGRKIEADLELKKEETKIFLERTLIEIKVGMLNDLKDLMSRFLVVNKSQLKDFMDRYAGMRDKCDVYMDDSGLADILQKGLDALVQIRVSVPDDKTLDEYNYIHPTLMATSHVSLRLVRTKLSEDLGFKTVISSEGLNDIDSMTARLVKQFVVFGKK